jgi:predicted DsbA family dithiol-disulfide isomerase
MTSLRLDIWSDIACPWCFVGKRRLEAALAVFEHASSVAIIWRSFELDPAAPRVLDGDYAERLARKYRVSKVEGEAMIARMTASAAGDGIAMRFDQIRPGNTFDAHRLLHLAAESGLQGRLKERFVNAYLCEGEAIGDPATLSRLATEVGLDGSEVSDVLGSDRYAAAVRADEAMARELAISGVPFFVLAGRIGVSGAQPAETLLAALQQAWTAVAAESAPTSNSVGVAADAAACGIDGCT